MSDEHTSRPYINHGEHHVLPSPLSSLRSMHSQGHCLLSRLPIRACETSHVPTSDSSPTLLQQQPADAIAVSVRIQTQQPGAQQRPSLVGHRTRPTVWKVFGPRVVIEPHPLRMTSQLRRLGGRRTARREGRPDYGRELGEYPLFSKEGATCPDDHGLDRFVQVPRPRLLAFRGLLRYALFEYVYLAPAPTVFGSVCPQPL